MLKRVLFDYIILWESFLLGEKIDSRKYVWRIVLLDLIWTLSLDDTADGVKMDAGEVTLVNHNSTFKTHLLPQSHFPKDQLSLSDQQVRNHFFFY